MDKRRGAEKGLLDAYRNDFGDRHFARPLCPAMASADIDHRPDGISEFRGEFMLMNRKWKLAINRQGHGYLLFDLENDPDETRNLAGLPESKPIEDTLRLRTLERISESQLKAP